MKSPPKLGGAARSAGVVCSMSRSVLIDIREAHRLIEQTAPSAPFLNGAIFLVARPPRLTKAGNDLHNV